MQLYIDTASKDKITVRLGKIKLEDRSLVDKSQKLLPLIFKALKKNRMSLKDISSIKINTGPGSYTGLRVGVSVGQALGWVFGIKVNGKTVGRETIKIEYE